ncbi:hypothetical protein WOLCODRAFT_140494 [Wolfiporia cocos MD-104 SS10]|uniref:Uncharacterized protein n=1 Tax=Wolfiporia cocos (strain MD-104) TaxID=742152 RepID=A0A2H3JFN7_WOLCO|nr:hypothetical protein WOLCODRAFT_140494 [Wolfiporia cocos MD-104 SS10]
MMHLRSPQPSLSSETPLGAKPIRHTANRRRTHAHAQPTPYVVLYAEVLPPRYI